MIAFASNLPFAADFDGDGRDSVGILRADGTVFAHADNASGRLPAAFTVQAGRLPVAGDFDGDGIDGFGTHDFATGRVELWNQTPPEGEPDHVLSMPPGWYVIAADLDGTGADSVLGFEAVSGDAVYLTSLQGPEARFATGQSGWPVTADLDDDGVDQLGIYRFDRDLAWVDREGTVTDEHPLGTQTLYQWPLAGRWSTTGTAESPTGFDWPESTPEAAGFDTDQLEAGVAEAGALPLCNSLLVAHQGKLVREAYFRGYDATRAINAKSASKSMLSALFGIAEAEGHLAATDTLASHLPELFGADARADITIEQLLTMRTALAWNELGVSIGEMSASEDWVAYVADQPLDGTPGRTFRYSTGNTHLGAGLLEAATGESVRSFAARTLFEPLGIQPTRWDVDPTGLDFGGAELWMRPRDLLRFGQLYLDGGEIDGVRILEASWIDQTFTDVGPGYGRWWWRWTLDGSEAWVALGYGGQLIAVVPDRDLVVVATSEWSVSGQASADQFAALSGVLHTYIVASAP